MSTMQASPAVSDDDIIQQALAVMENRMRYASGPTLTNPENARNYLRLRLGELEREVFAVVFLDNQNRLISYQELFFGTLAETSVYPREVVKLALKYNAAAVIFSHNHPSGHVEPSNSDIRITKALQSALDMVGVRVLDHIVVSATSSTSFAERGLL